MVMIRPSSAEQTTASNVISPTLIVAVAERESVADLKMGCRSAAAGNHVSSLSEKVWCSLLTGSSSRRVLEPLVNCFRGENVARPLIVL